MSKVTVIAEAGVNHNGDFDLAKELIKVAADAKADYVKFQTFKADKLVSKLSKKAAYQIANLNDGDDSQYGMLKKLELPEAWHFELKKFAEQSGIKFLSTGFDVESIDFLDKLGIDFFKVPSGEITNLPYLIHIGQKGRPIVLSTGMATLEEVKNAINVLETTLIKRSNIQVLHCSTDYPAAMKDVNLHAMQTMARELQVGVGYSDHTSGIEVSIAAVALGAKIIEKHFTIDRNLPGPDHQASLEPYELKEMVRSIRNIELAISGNGIKEPSSSELENRLVVRKSIHLTRAIKKGEILHEKDLTMMRPATGISPMDMPLIIGRITNQDLSQGDVLKMEHLL